MHEMARWMHKLRAGRRLARPEQDEKPERRGRVDLFFPSCDPVFWSTDWSIGPWWPSVDMGQAVCACVPGLLLYVDIGLRLGPIYNYMLCLCWAVGPGHAIFLLGSNVVKKCRNPIHLPQDFSPLSSTV